MTDSPFIPRFFFGNNYNLVIGIDSVSGNIFFLREKENMFYADQYKSQGNEKAWDEKVKEVAGKLLEANEEEFNKLLKETQLGNPKRKEAQLLMSVRC